MKRMIDGTSRGGQKKRARARLFADTGECEVRWEGGAKGSAKSRNDYPLLRITALQISRALVLPLVPLYDSSEYVELASFRIIFILSLNFSHDRIIHPNRKRGEIKMREGKIVGAIKVLYDSSRKPTNFHLPKARTEEKEASFVSLLSFFSTLSSLVRKIEDSRLTGNSADNPQSLASGQFRNQRR